MNITDLDDKTIQGAEAAGMTPMAFAARNIADIEKTCRLLGIQLTVRRPRASDHVDDMIEVVEQLVAKGYAYEKLQSLYFDISRFDQYGQLSGIDLNKIKLGATVDLDEYEKDNPRDFTLLKRVKLAELKKGIYYKTQWGNVRPSWPLQCATLALKYLGETLDVYIAGRELMFPLNENEIAIAGAVNKKPLARFWLHCDRVLVNGQASDHHGEKLTVQDLRAAGWSGREIRFWLLSTHYRKTVHYSKERLQYARHTLKRLDACVAALIQLKEGRSYKDLDQLLYDLKSGFISAMGDDLNISAALAAVFKIVKQLNRLTSGRQIAAHQVGKVLEALSNIDSVLNIFHFQIQAGQEEIKELMAKRDAARREKNWKLADQLRDKLIRMGVAVRDAKI